MRKARLIEPPQSFVRHNRDGTTTFVGALATKLYQAQTLRAAMAAFLGPASARRLLTVVQAFTGHRYADGDRLKAMADLDQWIAAMELVVPEFEEEP